jgi:predicted RNA binding protein YcfA (HicA-like mRNA interferase family)
MPEGYYRDVIDELKALGYVYAKHAKGSHEKWVKPGVGGYLIVPGNLKRRHTANAILKAAGSKKKL